MNDQQLRDLFEEDARAVAEDARIPAAGQVWWRAAMRARMEAVQEARRPLAWSQGLAAACTVGLVAALAGTVTPALASIAGIIGATAGLAIPLSFVVTCVALFPLALYLAFSGD